MREIYERWILERESRLCFRASAFAAVGCDFWLESDLGNDPIQNLSADKKMKISLDTFCHEFYTYIHCTLYQF